MPLSRRAAVRLLGGGCASLYLAGCGGGNGENADVVTIRTDTNGRVEDGFLLPRPGDAFITRTTDFEIAWADTAPPPSEWTVALKRYKEGLGGESRDISTQKIDVTPIGTNRWRIARKDNFDLDTFGTYYLELGDFSGIRQIAYIADVTRAAEPPSTTRAETIRTDGNGTLRNVQFSPTAGSCFIPAATDFTMLWNPETPPPSEVRVEIRRYKEARGNDNQANYEQEVEVFRNTNLGGYAWTVRRRDNFNMEKNGVYYIALRTPGQESYFATYIIGDF